MNRRHETEDIRAVTKMKMDEKRHEGRPMLTWKNTVRRDLNAGKIRERLANDREKWKVLCKTRTRHRETAAKVDNYLFPMLQVQCIVDDATLLQQHVTRLPPWRD